MEIWNWFKDLWNLIKNWKETLSFKIHEDDARDIYPELCKEINNAVDSIKEVYLDVFGTSNFNIKQNIFTDLEKQHKHILISEALWIEIQKFLIDFKKLKELKKEIFLEIEKILKTEKYPRIAILLESSNPSKKLSDIYYIIYGMVITNAYSLTPFKKATIEGITPEDITNLEKDIKGNQKIQNFIRDLEKFESFSKKIRKQAMEEYKKNLQKPELTRNVLTVVTIGVALLAVFMAVFAGYVAWQEMENNEVLMKDNKLLIERQLDSLSPVKPHLEYAIANPNKDLLFNVPTLANTGDSTNDNKRDHFEWLYLILYNTGQSTAKGINIQTFSNEQINCVPEQKSIDYINSTDNVGIGFRCNLIVADCQYPDEFCNSSLINLGTQNLRIEVTCESCDSYYAINETISICVYENNEEECK